MKGKKVAIFQNTLTGGGRIRVVNALIEIFNALDIIPDVFTLRVNNSFRKEEGLNFRIIKLPSLVYGLYELKIIALNWQVRKLEDGYDLLINSNNSLVASPLKTRTLAYIHFPREARINAGPQSLAFPENRSPALPFIFSLYRKLLGKLQNQQIGANIRLIANSSFTRRMLISAYPGIIEKDISVIYPPISTDFDHAIQKEADSVATLGRFSPDKRQLEQIEVARKLPNLKFKIIGFAGNAAERRYYNLCQASIERNGIKNVTLHPNLTSSEVKRYLCTSQFFLHSLRNEPFGISTVEAIAAGCIPIVHDSGGQREIVPFQELRYSSVEDSIEVLKQNRYQDMKNTLKALQVHTGRFSKDHFSKRFKSLLADEF